MLKSFPIAVQIRGSFNKYNGEIVFGLAQGLPSEQLLSHEGSYQDLQIQNLRTLISLNFPEGRNRLRLLRCASYEPEIFIVWMNFKSIWIIISIKELN